MQTKMDPSMNYYCQMMLLFSFFVVLAAKAPPSTYPHAYPGMPSGPYGSDWQSRRVQTTWPRIVPRVEGWEKHSELKIGYPMISSAFPHLMSAHPPARLPFDPDQEPPKTL
jgi:hypothetical protein